MKVIRAGHFLGLIGGFATVCVLSTASGYFKTKTELMHNINNAAKSTIIAMPDTAITFEQAFQSLKQPVNDVFERSAQRIAGRF